ncbi:FKBP-type peptidyl-prolyl cis-trans isomerase [Flavobacterium marginilacus]|uniref:FKBP-type peptidyl-prolyl cis-trans isomerase n=1 Tax=Flavobacterium marginilacus TaxID=3003256 RepID=UPI00248DDF25|nr:FKBP-type peptidylprolyl isomerase [Flavobacterium marginilacus]
MSKIKFYFILLIGVITVISCNKSNDDIEVTPPKPYAEQYPKDIALIETFLKTNYISVVNAPGETKDQDVTIAKLDADHTVSIWDQKVYALKFRKVELHGIIYTLYYLVLREGTGEKPCNVDDVFTSYNGKYLAETTTDNVTTITSTQFEEVINPSGFVNLFGYIRGWKEIFPQFKSGDAVSNPDGTVKYTNFGAGVMFIPSGLAYYNTGNGTIPAYSPLVFSFKLYKIKRSDIDNYRIVNGLVVTDPDGVLSYQEDIDGDGYVWTTGELPRDAAGNLINPNPDDTDGDGTPDFLDFDDDGDGYATRGEVKKADGTYYAFENIPDCDGNLPTDKKKKRHLDKECHKMSQ